MIGSEWQGGKYSEFGIQNWPIISRYKLAKTGHRHVGNRIEPAELGAERSEADDAAPKRVWWAVVAGAFTRGLS